MKKIFNKRKNAFVLFIIGVLLFYPSNFANAFFPNGIISDEEFRDINFKTIYDGEYCFNTQAKDLNDLMVDWKTYRNKKYGYEVKYPPYLYAKASPSDNYIFIDKKQFYIPPAWGGPLTTIQIAVTFVPIANKLMKIRDSLTEIKENYAKVGGYKAVELHGRIKSDETSEGYFVGCWSIYIIFQKNEKVFIISYVQKEKQENNIELFKKIVSTFKFIQ